MQLPSCFVNVRDPNDLIDFDYLSFVLVVEKETVFTHLIQMTWYTRLEELGLSQHVLIVTAKG